MRNKRIAALFMTAMMTVSALSGCGEPADDKKDFQAASSEKQQESSEAGAETDAAENLYEEEVNLVYVLPQVSEEMPGFDKVAEEVNRITKEKINATIEFEWIPLGEYTDKMNMKFTAGEEFDLCFTGAWNPYLSAVTQGAYAELTEDVLNTYAPEYMAQLNPVAWEAVTVDGKIYGAPIEQIYVRQSGLYFNTELADKYSFDYNSVTSLENIEEYLQTIEENENKAEITTFLVDQKAWKSFVSYFGWDVLVSETVPGVVYSGADTPEVVNQFATEEFKAYCEKMREWAKAGYLPEDAVTGAESNEGKTNAVYTLGAVKPGGDVTESQARGYEVKAIGIGNADMTTSAITATVTAVSATSKNVERAVAFINLLNTDKEILNLICHGVEGVDWQFTDEENGVIESISDYPGLYSFFVGCVFNEYYTDATMVGTWEETAEINANAGGSCILGFTFDSEPVSTQIAQCSAVVEEHVPGLVCGVVDVEEGLNAFLAALEDAGVNEILAEMQSQIDAWK